MLQWWFNYVNDTGSVATPVAKFPTVYDIMLGRPLSVIASGAEGEAWQSNGCPLHPRRDLLRR